MVAAIVETHQFLADPKNFDEALKVAEKYFEGIDPKLLRQMLGDGIKAYRPLISRQAMTNIGEMLLFAGLIKKPPVYEDIVDVRYVPTKFP
jgi:hypothetical protein